jgi:hypothetical protein
MASSQWVPEGLPRVPRTSNMRCGRPEALLTDGLSIKEKADWPKFFFVRFGSI